MKVHLFVSLLALCMGSVSVQGQSVVRGYITNKYGDPLAFATIYVEETKQGTAANEEGYFELNVESGSYHFLFQFLGYRAQRKEVVVGQTDVKISIELRDESYELQTIVVGEDQEDPAYAIMRKAIAYAQYHRLQIESYETRAYIKGSFRLLKAPRIFSRQLEKEGIDSSGAFTEEAVSEITYTRPNEWHERVISRRTIGNQPDEDPLTYIKASFYNEEVGDVVSPLSARAFGFYKFEYAGFTNESGKTINKIRVIPRQGAKSLFEGYIYIIDELWSLHSVDVNWADMGFAINWKQVYKPFDHDIWLPVNHVLEGQGKLFGFKFEYKYLVNNQDYTIALNPGVDFVPEAMVIESEPTENQTEQVRAEQSELEMVMAEMDNKENLSNKDLRKLVKAYEREEKAQAKLDSVKHVDYQLQVEIDTLAYERDSAYWQRIRPIPLTTHERIGYTKLDSIIANDEDTMTYYIDGREGGSIGVDKVFEVSDLITGANYKLGNNVYGGWRSPLLNTHYNTVEGWNIALPFRLHGAPDRPIYWEIEPQLHYAFSRKRLNANLEASLSIGKPERFHGLRLDMGRRTRQYQNRAISPIINDIYTLLLERNYLKLYEQEYIDAEYSRQFSYRIKGAIGIHTSKVRHLVNMSSEHLFDSKDRNFTSNDPYNVELGGTSFENYRRGLFSLRMEYKPWLTYDILNGVKRPNNESSPTLTLEYLRSIRMDDKSPEYNRIEIGLQHRMEVGLGSVFRLQLLGGGFWDQDNLRLADFKHFRGNRTDLSISGGAPSYKLLPYYEYSTGGNYYIEAHLDYEFREFLLTRLVSLQFLGIRESLSLGWLETDALDQYMEIGYGINHIFRFVKLEVVASYDDFNFRDWGIRIGFSTELFD